MAYTEIQSTAAGTPSALGDYSFNCVFDDSPTLGQYARASMSKNGQTVYKTVSLPNVSQIDGYSIEANETEATVYAVVRVPTGDDERISPIFPGGIAGGGSAGFESHYESSNYQWDNYYTANATGDAKLAVIMNASGTTYIIVGAKPEGSTSSVTYRTLRYRDGEVYIDETRNDGCNTYSFTYNGKTVTYSRIDLYPVESDVIVHGAINQNIRYDFPTDWGAAMWTMIYGTPSGDEYETKEILVGRFAIDLGDADGGPGGDWIDPGDYDPDWEEGDPTHTLYVTVTGALSGRHNDPIEDPSYSYIPADKDTVKDYGCGGDGGHGGGGGAGASTVVVHKFATNQANSKEVTALARRHGYGSGGGKGGKGGDGCILVYY